MLMLVICGRPAVTRGGAEDMVGNLDHVEAHGFCRLGPIANLGGIVADESGWELCIEAHDPYVSVSAGRRLF